MTTIAPAAGSPIQYSRLGLAPGATLAEVKRAYRRLAMDYHPDRAGSAALQSFLAIKAAYDWIVAHPSSEGGPVWDAPTMSAPRPPATPRPPSSVPTPPHRGTWPGGRWYWEGLLARAARR